MDYFVPITAQAAAPQGSGILGLVPIIFLFVIFYVLLLRPQMRKQRQHDQMVKELRPKDKVVMNSGLYGTIVKVTDSDVVIEVSDKVHLRFQRSTVGTVRNRESEGDEKA